MDLAQKLKELGYDLPPPAAPVASYIPVSRSGNLLFVSGQLCFSKGAILNPGIVGRDVTLDQAIESAKACALNIMAQIQNHPVKRIVRLGGFVASTPDFTDQPKVINGASDLFQAVFGEDGRHARAAVGVASLPLNASVEIEAIVELES